MVGKTWTASQERKSCRVSAVKGLFADKVSSDVVACS